jgi:hypothetical protein
VLAGTIAASLFKNQAWLSIACALVMLVLLWMSKGAETGGIFAGSAANVGAKARRTLLMIGGDADLYAGVALRPAADDGRIACRGRAGRCDGRRCAE